MSTQTDQEALSREMLAWLPAAERAFGLSGFRIVVEDGSPFICHERADDRVPTTMEKLRAVFESDCLIVGLGPDIWRGTFEEALQLPKDRGGGIPARFSPKGLIRMLRVQPDAEARGAIPPRAIAIMDVAAAALDEARRLVRDLSRAVDSGESGDPEGDEGHLAIVRMIIIPELERLPEERPEEINVAERIGFFQRLRTFVWDTRVIGLISLIVNIYTKMG